MVFRTHSKPLNVTGKDALVCSFRPPRQAGSITGGCVCAGSGQAIPGGMCAPIAAEAGVVMVEVYRMSNGRWAFDFGKPGPFITLPALKVEEMVRALLDAGWKIPGDW